MHDAFVDQDTPTHVMVAEKHAMFNIKTGKVLKRVTATTVTDAPQVWFDGNLCTSKRIFSGYLYDLFEAALKNECEEIVIYLSKYFRDVKDDYILRTICDRVNSFDNIRRYGTLVDCTDLIQLRQLGLDVPAVYRYIGLYYYCGESLASDDLYAYDLGGNHDDWYIGRECWIMNNNRGLSASVLGILFIVSDNRVAMTALLRNEEQSVSTLKFYYDLSFALNRNKLRLIIRRFVELQYDVEFKNDEDPIETIWYERLEYYPLMSSVYQNNDEYDTRRLIPIKVTRRVKNQDLSLSPSFHYVYDLITHRIVGEIDNDLFEDRPLYALGNQYDNLLVQTMTEICHFLNYTPCVYVTRDPILFELSIDGKVSSTDLAYLLSSAIHLDTILAITKKMLFSQSPDRRVNVRDRSCDLKVKTIMKLATSRLSY